MMKISEIWGFLSFLEPSSASDYVLFLTVKVSAFSRLREETKSGQMAWNPASTAVGPEAGGTAHENDVK